MSEEIKMNFEEEIRELYNRTGKMEENIEKCKLGNKNRKNEIIRHKNNTLYICISSAFIALIVVVNYLFITQLKYVLKGTEKTIVYPMDPGLFILSVSCTTVVIVIIWIIICILFAEDEID
jgi:hypothetical protein